jgi:hypothetical protein
MKLRRWHIQENKGSLTSGMNVKRNAEDVETSQTDLVDLIVVRSENRS